MKVSNTSKRLKQLMSERNIRQVDILRSAESISEKYGIKIHKSDISQYVSGKIEPMQDKLFLLGKALHVSPVWLMGLDVPQEEVQEDDIPGLEPLPKSKNFPIIGTIACGEPILAEQNIEGYVTLPDNEVSRADFVLRCKGDSMIDLHIIDGSLVFIRIQPEVENGETAAVQIDNEAATLKRFFKYPGMIMLQAANSEYQPMIFAGEEMSRVRVIGKAVGCYTNLE